MLRLVALAAGRPKILERGDDVAGGLGVPIQRTRLVMLVPTTAACAVATAAVGPVPFVALIARSRAAGPTRPPGPNLLAATCTGALLMGTADFASQCIRETAQLPVGVVTAAVGGAHLGAAAGATAGGAHLKPLSARALRSLRRAWAPQPWRSPLRPGR